MLPQLFGPLSDWVFVAGKGGVGKTTVAAALAISLADAGEETIVLSTDPAHSLGDALQRDLGGVPRPVRGVPRLSALQVDAEAERSVFLHRYGESLRDLLERGTYLERSEVEDLLGLPVPGLDELAALFRLVELSSGHERVVIDTAPTGHTLRLIAAPRLAEQWLEALESLDSRHQAVAAQLSGSAAPGDARRMIETVQAGLRDLRERLRDPLRASFLMVTLAEPVVEAETIRYLDALRAAAIQVAGIVVNRAAPGPGRPPGLSAGPVAFVPEAAPAPVGIDRLRSLARSASLLPTAKHTPILAPDQEGIRFAAEYRPPLDRGLYLVVGKGGVGKTTVASALSVLLARQAGRDVLLLSTDPAGSLGDVWGVEVGPIELEAPGESRIRLRQMDAGAVWQRFRDAVRAELAQHSDQLLESGVSVGADSDLLARLLDVAPPGIDELMALVGISERIESAAVGALVLDTAPTGHLLRLLEVPELALQWTHTAMRLLLKYREAIGLGSAAEEVLRLARRVRRLRDRLRNPEGRFVALVALADALNVAEAERLLAALNQLELAPDILLVNRLQSQLDRTATADPGQTARLLSGLHFAPPSVAAPAWNGGPAGAEELFRFAAEWRSIELDYG